MDGINSDKVSINLGGSEGGSGMGGMAAVIAALGNRNQGNDNAALIAALGNRNDGHRDNDGFGGGLGMIALLALLGRRGFGGGDDDNGGDGCARTALTQTILEAVGEIRASVPATALETQNALQGALASLALGAQQGFSNLKDSVQAVGALNLSATNQVGTAVLTTGLQTQIAIGNDGDKTRELINRINEANLQRQLTVAENALAEERFQRRSRDVEVNVSQNMTNTQVQAQFQAQFQAQGLALQALRCEMAENTQYSRATAANTNFIIGNTGASSTGVQTATPTSTNVNAKG